MMPKPLLFLFSREWCFGRQFHWYNESKPPHHDPKWGQWHLAKLGFLWVYGTRSTYQPPYATRSQHARILLPRGSDSQSSPANCLSWDELKRAVCKWKFVFGFLYVLGSAITVSLWHFNLFEISFLDFWALGLETNVTKCVRVLVFPVYSSPFGQCRSKHTLVLVRGAGGSWPQLCPQLPFQDFSISRYNKGDHHCNNSMIQW